MKYTVYLRTNLVNGKQYVGQTSNIRCRNNQFNCFKAKYSNEEIEYDRNKYGLENFKTEILAEVETREEALELEEKYIKNLNTIKPNGYNVACGGKNNTGCEKGKHNGRGFKKGDEPWNKGVKGIHLSPETEWKGKSVVRLKENEPIAVYSSILEAVEKNKCCYSSSIAQCCKGKRKTAGGFKWMYKEDYDKMKNGEVITPPIIV